MSGITITHGDGTVEILYEPTEKQAEFHARTEPNVLFYGGRGSGKSVALRWEAHMRALSHPGFTYAILRRTYPELQRSHLLFIDSEMDKLGGTFHKTDHIAFYPNGSKGFFSQCEEERDVQKLLSQQFAWMGFDELSTFDWEKFIRLSISVRVSKGSGLIAMVRGCTNPIGASAEEINRYFITKDIDPRENPDYVPSDWHAIKANMEDNPHLDQDQYRKRFAGLSEDFRKAWIEGDFVNENALFHFQPRKTSLGMDGVERNLPYHVIEDLDIKSIIENSTIYRAVDVGWWPDPSVCLWIAHLGNRHIVLHEEQWHKTIAPILAEDIRATTKRLGINRVAMTFCDPSMDINTTADVRSVKRIFEDNGVPMENSINNREFFATFMQDALHEEVLPGVPKLQIYRPGCPNLVKTIPQMKFDVKHPERMADHPRDHWVVTLAYYLMSHSSDPRRPIGFLTGGGVKKWMKPKKSKDDRFVLGDESVKDRSND